MYSYNIKILIDDILSYSIKKGDEMKVKTNDVLTFRFMDNDRVNIFINDIPTPIFSNRYSIVNINAIISTYEPELYENICNKKPIIGKINIIDTYEVYGAQYIREIKLNKLLK